MNELSSMLASEFEDKEYAHGYVQSHLVEKIASQVYALRKQRGLTQVELAEASGVPQGKISKIESGDFDSLALATLFKLAQAFDVSVDVNLQSFCHAIKDITESDLSKFTVPTRTDDLHAHGHVMLWKSNPMFDPAVAARGIPKQFKSSVTERLLVVHTASFTPATHSHP